jgi:hypothetical protein
MYGRENISEDTYLQQIRANEQWDIQPETLKTVIRNNFHQEIEGTVPVLMNLSTKYDLVLLSEHARKWVSYIKTIHPFLGVFEQRFFDNYSNILDDRNISLFHRLFG